MKLNQYVVIEQKVIWDTRCWSSEVEVHTRAKSIHTDKNEAFNEARRGLYWYRYGKYFTSNNPDDHSMTSFKNHEIRRYVLKVGGEKSFVEGFGHCE